MGTKKSPRGQVIIAEMMLIVGKYYEGLIKEHQHSQAAAAHSASNAAAAASAASGARAGSRKPTKRSRGGAVVYQGDSGASEVAAAANSKKAKDVPWKEAFDLTREKGRTEAEINACPHSLHAIRVQYGPIAERLIAMLLTFDGLA
eukprot:4225320-Pleurochrysis_carterae.AAC.1